MDDVLEVFSTCCAELDVHKKTVVAGVLITSPQGRIKPQISCFHKSSPASQSMDFIQKRWHLPAKNIFQLST